MDVPQWCVYDLKCQGFLRSIELIGISRNYNGVFCKNLGTIDEVVHLLYLPEFRNSWGTPMLPDSVILGNCAILWVYCEFIGVFFIVEITGIGKKN